MPADRDELRDYGEGKLHGGGGDSVGGAMGRAEHYRELERQTASRAPFSADAKWAIIRALLAVVAWRWALVVSGGQEILAVVAGVAAFFVLGWPPLARIVQKVLLVFVLICLFALGATMLGAENEITKAAERLILLIVTPVLDLFGPHG